VSSGPLRSVRSVADTNWFYSTLAQSSAAIVGLAGGFMFSRILALRSDLGTERRGPENDLVNLWLRMTDMRSRAIAIVESMDELLPAARAERTLPSDRAYSFSHTPGDNVSWALDDGELSHLDDLRRAAVEVLAALDALGKSPAGVAEHLRADRTAADLAPSWLLTDWPANLGGGNFMQELGRQRDFARRAFSGVTQAYETLRGNLGELRSIASIGSLVGLLAVLAAFLLLGVAWPLAYLSARGGATKPVLLALFVLLGLSFLGFLGNEIRRLRNGLLLDRSHF
jgi:hypothetical protein